MVYSQGGGLCGITSTFTNCLQLNTLLASSSNGTVLNFTYCFNATVSDFAQACTVAPVVNNGNVARIANNPNTNRSQRFIAVYPERSRGDELNRIRTALTQATVAPHAWGLSFGYDVWANLLSATVTQGNPPALSVAVTTKNQITGYCYDAAGNLIIQGACGPALVYQYDAENRMTTTAGVTYTYDGDGKRVKKSNGKLYWYGTSSDSLVETDLAGNNATDFVFFSGKRIARRDPAGTISYFFSDHLGSSRVVTNATGTIVEDSDFYPFGGERVVVDALNNQYKFTGKERDLESNLDFFIARYYSSNLGRFLSPDEFTSGPVDAFSSSDPLPPGPLPYAEITNPQSLNKYTYTYNSPLRYTDPDGHFIESLWDAANVAAGIVSAATNLASGNYKAAAVDAVGVAADTAALLTPGVPGGAAAAIRVARVADKVADAAKSIDKVSDATKLTNRAQDVGGAATNITRKETFEATSENVARMEKGKSPIGADGKSVELHHPNQKPGKPVEMTQTDHRGAGNYDKNHPTGNREPSQIDRQQAAADRREHWKQRADELKERKP